MSDSEMQDAQPSGLDEYNPIEIKDVACCLAEVDHFSLICIGMRRTGKTFIVDAILHEMHKKGQHFDVVYLFSETAWKLSQWKMISKMLRYEGFQSDVLKQVLSAQRQILEHNENTEEIDQHDVPRVLVVLDDIAADRGVKWGHSADELQRLYVQGRHSAISVVTIIQHPKSVSPAVRSNADCILQFRSPSALHRKDLIEQYCTTAAGRDSYKEAERFYEAQFNTKHACLCLMLCKSAGCKHPREYCFSCTADEKPPPEYRLGDARYWPD